MVHLPCRALQFFSGVKAARDRAVWARRSVEPDVDTGERRT